MAVSILAFPSTGSRRATPQQVPVEEEGTRGRTNKRPLDGQNLANRTLKPILKAAKLSPRFRWYDCRHTCATLLLAAGENPKVVRERLGHKTVAFTLDRYGHVLPRMQSSASNRLEAMPYPS